MVVCDQLFCAICRKFFKRALRKRVAPEKILVIASRSNAFLKVRNHAWQVVKVLGASLLPSGSTCSRQSFCTCMRGML